MGNYQHPITLNLINNSINDSLIIFKVFPNPCKDHPKVLYRLKETTQTELDNKSELYKFAVVETASGKLFVEKPLNSMAGLISFDNVNFESGHYYVYIYKGSKIIASQSLEIFK
jgi:hypothetical protein